MRRICYYPELVQKAGSINATLMMAQLEFWFKLTGGRPFYKFLEPCGHELYKEGDSWSEELGMTSSEIRSAFKHIGTIYKSKRAFRESQDVFKGKPYASYYDRIRKTTYYLRNTEKVKQMMPWDTSTEACHQNANTCQEQSTYKQTNSKITSMTNSLEDRYVTQDCLDGGYLEGDYLEGDGSVCSRDYSEDGCACSKVGTNAEVREVRDSSVLSNMKTEKEARESSVTNKTQDGLYREDYIDNNIQDKQIRQQKESYSLIPYTDIVKLYNEHLGEALGYVTSLTQQEKESVRGLWLKFNIKLEDFKQGFMKVAASRFLCGKVNGKHWKASLKWLIAGGNFSKVLAGEYDDFISQTANTPKCTGLDKIKEFNQMESHHWDFDEIERLERLYLDRKLSGILA